MFCEDSSKKQQRVSACVQAAGQRDWSLPESHQMQLEGAKELYVGGVHVHIFLKDPHFPLRNPKVGMHDQHGHVSACWALHGALFGLAVISIQIAPNTADTHTVRVSRHTHSTCQAGSDMLLDCSSCCNGRGNKSCSNA